MLIGIFLEHRLARFKNTYRMKIEFKKVDRNFNEVKAVSRVTLEITPTTFVALVGPSGAGKSTLLKMINGLQTPDAGIVLLDDEDVALKPKAMLRRRIGYVFQSIGLFPHLTVSENIAIGPRLQKERVSEERMSELLQLLELEPGIGNRMPHELSGGQQQRVGIARAVVNKPPLLLADEPTGNLDAELSEEIMNLFRDLNRVGVTVLVATHDLNLVHQMGCLTSMENLFEKNPLTHWHSYYLDRRLSHHLSFLHDQLRLNF